MVTAYARAVEDGRVPRIEPAMLDLEEWRPVLDWEDIYEASSIGRIRNHTSGHVLAPALRYDGYLQVRLCRRGTGKSCLVHPLILTAFAGRRPPGMEVLHGNGRKADNRLSNLRFGTHSENMREALTHGVWSHGH